MSFKFINKIISAINIGCLLVSSQSCNLINPDEDIPSYIKIDSISLATDFSTQGSNSHKIVDVWLYVDNNPVGVYQLPCVVPVLEKGSHNIVVAPGVLLNGISATHLNYPFYKSISRTVELKEGEITNLDTCVTKYYETDTFPIKEDFEAGITYFTDTIIRSTNLSTEVFEGVYSGKIKLETGQTNFEIKSIPVELPNAGALVYLEMNYKCDIAFNVGLQIEDFFGNKIESSIIKLNPKSDWNKIYIELAPTIGSVANGYKYSLIFGTVRTETPEAFILFDNIKVVHFK
ncbi:MAG: hypothetical protein IPJ79_20445 [Bacteroidetes bacterium]|nr:hypothetical protein [Bacteroidota bacterium]